MRGSPSCTGLMRQGLMLVALAVLGVGVASANTPPLADAGLDQQVEENTTVYLDAGGSTDPDGNVTGYEWSITAPNGTELTPDCESCARTEFVPERTGQYNATVAVTDDDGATREDTLYVDVETATPPSVTVSGPDAVIAGDAQTYTADASAGGDDLSTITWRVDGSHRAHVAASGDAETVTREFSFEKGEHTVTVVVIDDSGKRESDEMTVEAVEPVGVGDGGGGGGGGGDTVLVADQENDEFDSNPDSIIEYNTNTNKWRIDQDRAERSEGSVQIGDAEISMATLEFVDSSEEFKQALDQKGVSEETALRAATAETNKPIQDTVGIEQHDPHRENHNSGQKTNDEWVENEVEERDKIDTPESDPDPEPDAETKEPKGPSPEPVGVIDTSTSTSTSDSEGSDSGGGGDRTASAGPGRGGISSGGDSGGSNDGGSRGGNSGDSTASAGPGRGGISSGGAGSTWVGL